MPTSPIDWVEYVKWAANLEGTALSDAQIADAAHLLSQIVGDTQLPSSP